MRTVSHPLKVLLFAALPLAGSAAAEGVLVDKSEIRFVAKQLGAAVEGRFRQWKADVAFLPQDLAHSRVVADIDLASIDLASEDSERELRGGAWFDTAKFPAAHFASTSVVGRGGDRYEIAGELSIKGFARPVTVPIALRTERWRESRRRRQLRAEASRLQGRRGAVGGYGHRRERGHGPDPHGAAAAQVTRLAMLLLVALEAERERDVIADRGDAALHPEVGALDLR